MLQNDAMSARPAPQRMWDGPVNTPYFANICPAKAQLGRNVCTVIVDAEEDFDWRRPVPGTSYSTVCMRNIGTLQEICGAYGVVPTYLLTYPVMEDRDAVKILNRTLEKGRCVLGVQLHSWVNPPLDEIVSHSRSFTGNLGHELEERKLIELKQKFVLCFGHEPRVFRAGRYGLGRHTALLLEQHGFQIDTSIAPRTNFAFEGGPDFGAYECQPFWFGEQRRLLELPLCRSIVGWSGRFGPRLYRAVSEPHFSRLRVRSILTRLRCAERITLSPEGNDVRAMRRLVSHLLGNGQIVFALSFHSSSLYQGSNPYVQSKADLHHFYDRLSAILDHMASQLSFGFSSTLEIFAMLAEDHSKVFAV